MLPDDVRVGMGDVVFLAHCGILRSETLVFYQPPDFFFFQVSNVVSCLD